MYHSIIHLYFTVLYLRGYSNLVERYSQLDTKDVNIAIKFFY